MLDECGPSFVNVWQFSAQIGRCWADSTYLGHTRAKFGQLSTDFIQARSMFVKVWSTSADVGEKLATSWPGSAEFGRSRPFFANSKFADVRPSVWRKDGHVWPEFKLMYADENCRGVKAPTKTACTDRAKL